MGEDVGVLRIIIMTLCQPSYLGGLGHLINTMTQERGTIIFFIFHLKKLKIRKRTYLVQGHRPHKQQNADSKPGWGNLQPTVLTGKPSLGGGVEGGGWGSEEWHPGLSATSPSSISPGERLNNTPQCDLFCFHKIKISPFELSGLAYFPLRLQ